MDEIIPRSRNENVDWVKMWEGGVNLTSLWKWMNGMDDIKSNL